MQFLRPLVIISLIVTKQFYFFKSSLLLGDLKKSYRGVQCLRVVKEVVIKFMNREAIATALFDTRSSYTVIRRSFFEKAFGATWKHLPKPVKLYLVNGKFVTADKYAVVTIVVNNVELSPPETVLILVLGLDEFVKEIEVGGRRIEIPDVIIGAGTMDKYCIVLDPREGVKVLGGRTTTLANFLPLFDS